MRRVFALLLLTPFLANCSPDSTPPLAASGAVHSAGDMPAEEAWPEEENWFTPGDVLTLAEDEEMSAQAVGAAAAPATGAVMEFGNPDAGSNFFPAGSHDQSFHARWKINPGTVVINAGERVTFKMNGAHRVAIYNDGVQPKDIQPNPGPFVLYPTGRLFLQPKPAPQFTLKFLRPGKYLVLCAISKHFFGANQWGWIIVR